MSFCPVCDAAALRPILRRDDVPVHQNMVLPSRAEARAQPTGVLDLAHCDACGFLSNRAFDAARMQYGPRYENRQDLSPAFDAYLDDVAAAVVSRGARDAHVVEVGCGTGDFLRRVCALGRNRGTGFDPSHRGPHLQVDPPMRFVRDLYGAKYEALGADVVVCRHVIEHVDRPRSLLQSVRNALRSSPSARVFFETPDLAWILENQVIQDLFYEHCSYFSAASLRIALLASGFCDVEIVPAFGGQYLWAFARVGRARHPVLPGSALQGPLERFVSAEVGLRSAWTSHLDVLRRDGGVALWGAGAKGVTFAHLVDPRGERVTAIVDINPAKQGGYLPATGHPVVEPAALRGLPVRHVILMNPQYRDEVRVELARHTDQVQLHDPELIP